MSDGLDITVDRVEYEDYTETETVAYTSTVQYTNSVAKGNSGEAGGREGVKTLTYANASKTAKWSAPNWSVKKSPPSGTGNYPEGNLHPPSGFGSAV